MKTILLCVTILSFARTFSAGLAIASDDTNDVSHLTAALLKLQETVDDLNGAFADIASLKSSVASLDGKVGIINQNMESLIGDNYNQDQQIKAIQAKENAVIAFSAYVSKTTQLEHYDTLIFDAIISNYGGAYNGECGIFKAPVHGVYHFTVNFITDGKHPATNLDIMINGYRKCIGYGDNAHRHTTGVCSVMAELKAGETAYIRHEDPHGDGGSVYNGLYTSFTGFLYTALEEEVQF